MDDYSKRTAEYLLQIKAIKLQPSNPFTWASGWKSPIYCDNRKTLSFPEVRSFLRDSFATLVRSLYPEAEMIARTNAKQLEKLIVALPIEFRETLVLRDLQGLGYREIAEVIGAPIGTVMSRLARARDRLLTAIRESDF